jgi:hypothetical protein
MTNQVTGPSDGVPPGAVGAPVREPTASNSPPPGESRPVAPAGRARPRLLLTILAVVVAIVLVVALLITGVIPGLHSSSATNTPRSFHVTFTETGLPSGTSWSVKLGNVTGSANAAVIPFSAPNGTYSYTIAPAGSFTATRSVGTVVVAGADVNVSVSFSSPQPLGTDFSWGSPLNESGATPTGCASAALYCYVIEIAGAGGGVGTSNIQLSLRDAAGAAVPWTTDTISLTSPTVVSPVATYNTTTASWTLVAPFTGALSGGFTIAIQPSATTHAAGLLGDQLVAIGVNGFAGTVPSYTIG